jgi:hypothetical protein
MRARFVSAFLCSATLIGASSSAAAQALSFGEIVGRIGGAFLGIGMAYTLEVTRAPDGPFGKDASEHDEKLAENLGKLLPEGTDLRAAATGFRNLGEFVTTVRVSSNLAIPFDELKSKVVAGGEVSDAIHSLRPEVDGLVEARKARRMARQDLVAKS